MQTRSFLRHMMDSLVEARARQASRFVNGALTMLDDDALKARGLSRDQFSGDRVHSHLI